MKTHLHHIADPSLGTEFVAGRAFLIPDDFDETDTCSLLELIKCCDPAKPTDQIKFRGPWFWCYLCKQAFLEWEPVSLKRSEGTWVEEAVAPSRFKSRIVVGHKGYACAACVELSRRRREAQDKAAAKACSPINKRANKTAAAVSAMTAGMEDDDK